MNHVERSIYNFIYAKRGNMKKAKYIWGSEKRRNSAKSYGYIGLFLFAMMVVVIFITIKIPGGEGVAIALCWTSSMYILMCFQERTEDRLEKLEKKYEANKNSTDKG